MLYAYYNDNMHIEMITNTRRIDFAISVCPYIQCSKKNRDKRVC